MSIDIKEHIPLAPLTTLGVGGTAEYFCEVNNPDELREAVLWAQKNHHTITILGGGSNVLVPDAGVQGLVIRLQFLGTIFTDDGNEVLVTAGAGVVLDTLVALLVEKGLWGLENFSAIPGSVGAVPIQNVGAYGLETKDILHSVLVYDRDTDATRTMTNAECEFSYRDSIFKRTTHRYCVLSVTFRVSTKPNPRLTYRDLEKFFATNKTPSLLEVRNAVIQIRGEKFPDWTKVGTAGSFFKNPIISEDLFASVTETYHDIPGFRTADGRIKISLGWVLDHVCGLRGFKEGNVRLFERQALVLVCERGATATEIEKFSQKIIDTVFQKTNIVVEREVTIIK